MMGMMPGMGKLSKQVGDAGIDDKILQRQIALIQSMTKKERANPQILQASRKKRIAAGVGLWKFRDLNKLLKMHRQMSDMMKKLGKGKGGMLRQAMKAMTGQGGIPRIWAMSILHSLSKRPRRWAKCPVADCRVLAEAAWVCRQV